jgi:hypothetical protein
MVFSENCRPVQKGFCATELRPIESIQSNAWLNAEFMASFDEIPFPLSQGQIVDWCRL